MKNGELKIGVVGGGSWGTALGNLLATKGFTVDLWVFEPEVKAQIADHGENETYLPGVSLSSRLRPTQALKDAVAGKDLVMVVVPSHVMREVCGGFRGLTAETTTVVSASKGIENRTHSTMTAVIKETVPEVDERRLAVLSGPSFAREVARGVPTAVTVASRDLKTAAFVQQVFASPTFRVYTHDDVLGVELGGSVKNVIAIAAGIIDGLGFGLNTRAALLTRAQAEIRRLGVALGANPRTFTGLAGIGDLILTCTGDLSRNYTVGKKLGQGMTLTEILAEMQMVAEGVKTARSVYNLSRHIGVEMPISNEVYHILYDDESPKAAVIRLMSRDLKQEMDHY